MEVMQRVANAASQTWLAVSNFLQDFWNWLDTHAAPLGITLAALSMVGGFIAFVGRNWIRYKVSRIFDRTSINRHLNAAIDRIRARTMPGLRRLTFGQILRTKGLRRPFVFKVEPDERTFSEEDLFKSLRHQDRSSKNEKSYLVLAEAGIGKSTLAIYIFTILASDFLERKNKLIPVYIDLRTYAFHEKFGTKDWLDGFLQELGLPAFDVSSRRHIIILDGLDELLSSREINQRSSTFDWILSVASVVTCRIHFFERYLSDSSILYSFEKLTLLDWGISTSLEYAKLAFKTLDTIRGDSLFSALERRLEASPQLVDLCTAPLRLNMYIDLILNSSDADNTVRDHVGLYQLYILETLRREESKSRALLEPHQALDALTHIAWLFYPEENGAHDARPFTMIELTKSLPSRLPDALRSRSSECARELVERSVLDLQITYGVAIEAEVVRFSHKSFQDYLVARHLAEWAVSDSEEQRPFSQALNPEVSEFLKELLGYISREPRLSEIAVRRLKTAYAFASTNSVSTPRRRVEMQQLAYYIGSIDHPDARSFLVNLAQSEPDLWIRRAVIIGLAFNGENRFFSEYIRDLRDERRSGGESKLNSVNIGFHLSFFGDQPLDLEKPEVDLGRSDCSKTIRRLTYQLTTETDRPNWRLNLYTLVDLFRYRDLSRTGCIQTLRKMTPVLRTSINRLRVEQGQEVWPEVEELDTILNGL